MFGGSRAGGHAGWWSRDGHPSGCVPAGSAHPGGWCEGCCVLCAQLCGEQSFPEMSWCLSVCQHLHSSDGKRSKVWTEGCCLPASGMLVVLSVPVVSRGSKLCNLIMHCDKKYILCFMHEGFSFFFFFDFAFLYFKKLKAIISHSCLLYY